MEERIWDWLDGQSSEAEATELQQMVEQLPEWKAKYHELLDVHHSLQHDLEMMQPSMRFTKNVMEQIAALSIQATTKHYLNNKVIYGIGGLFVALITGIVLYALAMIDWGTSSSSSGTSLPSVKVPGVDWGNLLSGNFGSLAMMILVLLIMVGLDQYLRPRLLKKSKGA